MRKPTGKPRKPAADEEDEGAGSIDGAAPPHAALETKGESSVLDYLSNSALIHFRHAIAPYLRITRPLRLAS